MQIGTLTAFLSYLIQILMSVMMATFMFMLLPRAEGRAERITEVLDTVPSVRRAGRRHGTRQPASGVVELDEASFAYPGAEEPVLHEIETGGPAGGDDRDHRVDRQRQVDVAQPHPAAVRRHGGVGAGRRHRRPCDCSPTDVWPAIGLVPQRPYLFTGTVATQPALRRARRHRRASCGPRWRSPRRRDFVEAMPEGLELRLARAARTSPVASGSASRSPAPSSSGPRIYLFDDSFSALDYATDAALRQHCAGDRAMRR